MSHIRVTVEDVADVALNWCMDDGISYEEEQKHDLGEDVVVPAIYQSTPPEQQFSLDKEDIGNEKVDTCTRVSHGVLAASYIVYHINI